MAINKRDIIDVELNTGKVFRSFLNHTIGKGDNQADQFGVRIFRDGQPVILSDVTCQGFFRDPHGNNIALTSYGTIEGNTAFVTLQQACYNYDGQFTLAIKLIGGGVTGTMRIVDGVIDNTNVDNPVAPTETVPTYQEILDVYEQMVAAKSGSVRFDEIQLLTDAQKEQARGNIEAASTTDIESLQDDIEEMQTDLESDIEEVQTDLESDIEEVQDDVDDFRASGSYNIHKGWNVNKSDSFPSSISVDNHGLVVWDTEAPAAAEWNSIRVYIGKYGDIKDSPMSIEFNGDSEKSVRFIFRLSNDGSWGSGTKAVVIEDITIEPNGKLYRTFVPATVLKDAGYTVSEDVHFSIEQRTKTGDEISVSARLNTNTLNSRFSDTANKSMFADHAGIENYEAVMPYLTDSMVDDIGASIDGKDGRYVISIPENSGSEEYLVYACISMPVKKLIAEKKKIRVTLSKTNTTGIWNWEGVRLSAVFNNWAPTNLIANVLNSPGNVLSAEYEIDLESYGIDVSDYGEIYLIFDTLISNPGASAGVDLVLWYKVMNGKAVVATDLEGFIQSDYYNKEEINEMLEDGQANTDIIFWGDSLTAGAGGGGTTYCAVCANLLGMTHKNCGVGGETEQTIAARQGGNNLIIPAGSVNGSYTFAQMLDEKGKQILPLRQGTGGNTVNPVRINGQDCTLSLTNETYTISGYTGTLLNEVPALFSGSNVYGKITVIFVGANGLGSNTVAERISYIRSMLTRIGKKYVVMGISYGDDQSREDDDKAMQAEFGNHFFPTRKMLVKYGLDVQGITPTSQDETDIASGTVPTSLRSDHIHLNADGYTALGKMLASFIVGIGYANYPED